MEQQSKKDFIINAFYVVIILMIIFLLSRLIKYVAPFIIAVVIANIVQKPAAFISKNTHISRGICAGLLFAAIFLLSVFLVGFAIYKAVIVAGGFFEHLPNVVHYIEEILEKSQQQLSEFLNGIDNNENAINTFFEETTENILLRITSFFSSVATNFAKAMPSFILSFFVTLVAGCYIAKDYIGLSKFFGEICGKRTFGKIKKIKRIFNENILKMLKGYIILMLIAFVELTIFFSLLRVKNAAIIALLVSIIDILPVLGIGTVLIPWAVFSFLLGRSSFGFALVVIYLFVTVMRNFLEPKIIGKQIGINPLFTLAAMFFGVKFFGIFGLFLFPIVLIVIIKYYKEEMKEESA